MPTFKISPRQLGRYEKALARMLPEVAKQVNEVAAQASVEILQRATLAIRPFPPVDTRRYYRGWFVQRENPHSVLIKNRAPYAGNIEDGRRRGAKAPPSKALVGWVQRKLHVPPNRARGVAFVVARKIAQRGIRAKPVVRRSRADLNRVYVRTLVSFSIKWLRDGHRYMR